MLLLRSRRSCKLKPFKIASKQLQGNGIMGKRSTSGGFDEYLPVVEMLLDHFETDLKGTIYEDILWRLIYLMVWTTRLVVSCKPISNLVGKSWISIIHSWLLLLAWAQSFSIHARSGRCWINFGVRRSTLWKDEHRNGMRAIWEVQYMNKDVSDKLSELSTCNDESLNYI